MQVGGELVAGVFEPGLTVNGVPVGTEAYVDHVLQKKVAELVSDNNQITNLLRARDPYALWSIVRLCRAPQFQHWMRYLDPARTIAAAAPLQDSLNDMTSAAAGSNEWRTNPVIERRVRLAISQGGGGIRALEDVAPAAFLGGLLQIAPMLLDRVSSTGGVVPGWAPWAAGALGAGLYDHGRGCNGRWTTMLSAQCAATGKPIMWATGLVDSFYQVRNDMLREGDGRDGTPWADGITVDDFGQGLSDRHAQRAITKMRESPRALNYLNDMLHRPSMDPHRVSYLEVSRKDEGAAIRTVLSTWPSAHRPLLPVQWITGFALIFGMRIPALATFVGAPIGTRHGASVCDAWGYKVSSAVLPGDGWRTRHDAINWSFSRFSTACQVPMTVEVYNLLCQHISQGGAAALHGHPVPPQPARQDPGRHHPPRSGRPVRGENHLGLAHALRPPWQPQRGGSPRGEDQR